VAHTPQYLTARAAVDAAAPRATSMFVTGHFPRHRGLLIGLSALAGFLLTVVWSANLVDDTIGVNVAGTLLGHEAKDAPIAGVMAGVAFAFATGLAGTFTACNVAVFGALAPLVGRTETVRGRLLRTLKPLALLSAGAVSVSAAYGVLVALVGTSMPQFQTAPSGGGWSPRMIQSMVAFGVIGTIMICLGLSAVGVVKDPLARLSARFPNAPIVLMGTLIGGFLIGRPYPLFRQMFRAAAESHNVAYGAVAFSLQSLGNIVVVSVVFVLMALLGGRRLGGRLAAHPRLASGIVAAAFLAAGVFTVLYWDVRVLARIHLIWYPVAPWS
jgi:hypothetical protein